MSDNWLLSVENLGVQFHSPRGTSQAVDGVSFEMNPHETLALVGETGCGKSVTARSILRLVAEPPGEYSSGSIQLRNEDGSTTDILSAPEKVVRSIRGNRISMIFQDPGKALNPALTVGRQVAEVFGEHRLDMVLEKAGVSRARASRTIVQIAQPRAGWLASRVVGLLRREDVRAVRRALDDEVASALADTGIANPRKIMASYPHELSGGMKQRVMIAQALACDPDLLVADEPTTALDVTIQARILKLIQGLQERRGTAILYITHDLSLVKEFADRVAVMYAGRIVEMGRSEDVLRSPQHPYTQGLLAAIPRADTPRGELEAIPGSVPQLIDAPLQCHFATRCAFASAVCREKIPVQTALGGDHSAACFRHNSAEELNVAASDMPLAASATGETQR
ncbi:MAG: ABC transporter ATP-binding protein [Pontimonas sp.]